MERTTGAPLEEFPTTFCADKKSTERLTNIFDVDSVDLGQCRGVGQRKC